MKIKRFLLGGLLSLAMSLGIGATLISTNTYQKEAATVEAATATTVYYAVPAATVGSYSVKLNINRQGDASNWAQYDMTRDGVKVQGGKLLYKATYTDLYDGVGCMQFQLYDGDTWKSQQQPIGSWTGVSTYNGKVYVHDTGWADYNPDKVSTTLAVNFTYDVPSYVDIYISGDFNGWTTTAKMTKSTTKKYTYSLTNAFCGPQQYKIAAAYSGEAMDWTYQIDTDNQDITLSTSDAGKTKTLGSTRGYNFPTNMPYYEIGYYLVSSNSSYSLSGGVKMASGGSNVYTVTKTFTANECVNVMQVKDYKATDTTWYNPTEVTCNHSYAYPVYIDNGNAKVVNSGSYTVSVNVTNSKYTFVANDFTTPSAVIYYSNGTTGEVSSYNSENQQSEFTVTFEANQEFVIRVTNSFGTFFWGNENVDTSSGSAHAASLMQQGSLKETGIHYIKVNQTKVYSVYAKDNTSIWIQVANDGTQAAAWATYFLNNVGCHADGSALPEGWSLVAARYETLPSTAKTTYLVNGKADEHSDKEVERALARYDYAVTHHSELTRFIAGRSISAAPRITFTLGNVSNNSNTIVIISIVSVISVSAVGGFFLLRKRKEN